MKLQLKTVEYRPRTSIGTHARPVMHQHRSELDQKVEWALEHDETYNRQMENARLNLQLADSLPRHERSAKRTAIRNTMAWIRQHAISRIREQLSR